MCLRAHLTCSWPYCLHPSHLSYQYYLSAYLPIYPSIQLSTYSSSRESHDRKTPSRRRTQSTDSVSHRCVPFNEHATRCMREMTSSNVSLSNLESRKPVLIQSPESYIRGHVLTDKMCTNPVIECFQSTRENGQKIVKSIHPPKDRTVLASNPEGAYCYVPVTDAEFDNLQRKYGELTGEIIIVEITVNEIQEILTSNYRNPVAHQQLTIPLSSPTMPVTSFQKPSNHTNRRVLKTLGISLCGNKDLNQMAVLVCGLRPGSIAEVDGRIAIGDQLLELNEHVLYGRSHLNAGPLIRSCLLSVLHRSSSKRSKAPSSLCFVICRNPENLTNMAVAPLSYVTNSQKVSRRGSVNTASGIDSPPRSALQVQGSPIGRSTFEEVHATRLLRGRNGFGFAIMDKSFTNEPGIYIKQLVENSPAALDGTLRAGDRILRVDWHDALHASYDSVLEWLRSARHQVRIVVSRVRLFTGENRPLEEEEPYKMGFRKRLSAPLISSLIHAFMHSSSSSASSKKSSLQFASMADTIASSKGEMGLSEPKHKGLRQPTVSETFDLLSPNIGVPSEARRASCPDAVIPGFAKRLAAKNFLGVVPMSSLTQLAGPPIPVLPLGVVSACDEGSGGSSRTSEAALQGRYDTVLERFAAVYRSPHNRRNGGGRDEAESATTRPILPGQKTLICIPKNPSLSLGISLIGGSETSLGVLQVHEIFSEGAVALDGRLKPGDRLLAVNNESLSNLSYAVAVLTIVAAFSGQTPLQSELNLSSVVAATSPSHCANDSGFITLVVERPGPGVQTKWYDQEVTAVLLKKPGRGLGLCIVERSGPTLVTANGVSFSSSTTSTASPTTPLNANPQPAVKNERSGLGVIVCDLIKGSAAQMDGRIMIGDQILAINDIDVENSSQEEVATLLKTAQGTVSLRLGRLKNQPIPINSVTAAFSVEQ